MFHEFDILDILEDSSDNAPDLAQAPFLNNFDIDEFDDLSSDNPFTQNIRKIDNRITPPSYSRETSFSTSHLSSFNLYPRRTNSVSDYFGISPNFSFNPRAKNHKFRPFLDPMSQLIQDSLFASIFQDLEYQVNPVQLNFAPNGSWLDRLYFFGELETEFFQKKNSSKIRLSYKLYNALKIVEFDEKFFQFIGVKWLSRVVFRVDKRKFARFLGVKSIDSLLFHQQGIFVPLGLIEITEIEASTIYPELGLTEIDFDEIRIFHHNTGLFTSSSTAEEIENLSS